ncbi:MAG: peptidylprolyl isomerase [Pontiella sp.]
MKRIALLTVLTGLMFGCQTMREPAVSDEIEARQETEHVAAEQDILETKKAEEVVPAEEVKPVEEVVKEEPEVALKQPVVEERKTIMILMKTSKGDIKLELDAEKAPKTVANFMKYVESGHYNDVIFHRVISGFMIQGGGFDENMNQKPAPDTVENEAKNGLKNEVGTIAMARTSDPHSGGAQFFINVKDNSFLNYPGQDGWGYCVFGKVVEGMDVASAIESVPTGAGDVPKEPIFITEVVVLED